MINDERVSELANEYYSRFGNPDPLADFAFPYHSGGDADKAIQILEECLTEGKTWEDVYSKYTLPDVRY